MRTKVLVGLLSVVVIAIISLIVVAATSSGGSSPSHSSGTTSPGTAPTPTPTPTTPVPVATPTPTPTTATFQPVSLTGSGSKTTAPFTVTTAEWVIEWSYTSDDPEWASFAFFVYPRGETALYVESMMFSEDTSGSTYSYAGPGEYYVEVSAANIKRWEIVIRPA